MVNYLYIRPGSSAMNATMALELLKCNSAAKLLRFNPLDALDISSTLDTGGAHTHIKLHALYALNVRAL